MGIMSEYPPEGVLLKETLFRYENLLTRGLRYKGWTGTKKLQMYFFMLTIIFVKSKVTMAMYDAHMFLVLWSHCWRSGAMLGNI